MCDSFFFLSCILFVFWVLVCLTTLFMCEMPDVFFNNFGVRTVIPQCVAVDLIVVLVFPPIFHAVPLCVAVVLAVFL